MKLQILIPRHNEEWKVMEPLLQSLSFQLGISFNEIGVLIGDDGSDEPLLDLPEYPFALEYFWQEHISTSAIRNKLLDKAVGEYIMYCDRDDMFFDMKGIRTIFNYIDNGGFDAFCSVFLEEVKRNGRSEFVKHEHDVQFVHGKVYRRQYLIEQNVRHDERLTGCHQDGYFNRLAKTMTSNFKYCEQPFYLWKWRDNSVARGDRKHMLKTYSEMLDANDALVDEYIRREKHRQAMEAVIGGVLDTYYTLQRSEWHLTENAEYLTQAEKRFTEYYEKNKTMWENAPAEIKVRMSHGIRQSSIRKGMLFENETLEQWLIKKTLT